MILHCLLLLACHPNLKDRPVLVLSVLDVSVKALDYSNTERDFRSGGFVEHDPVIRPMLGHPAALTAFGGVYAITAAVAGHMMRRSRFRVVRDLYWVPQTLSIGQNVYGYSFTRAHYRR